LKVKGVNPFNDLERTNTIKKYQQGNLKALRGYIYELDVVQDSMDEKLGFNG
jgi:hypothetical protein